MLDLSHMALLEYSKSNACDTDNPIIMDQVFGAEMTRLANEKKIGVIKNKIKNLKRKVYSMCSLNSIKINYKQVNMITSLLSHELFEVFHWNRVTTKAHASWKEYFQMMYDLLVYDYSEDHTTDILLSRTVIKYHDILTVPEEVIEYNDPMYSIISSLKELFEKLKKEQMVLYSQVKSIKNILRQTQKDTTCVQHEIIDIQQELRALEEDNKKYIEIIKWSLK